MSRGAFAKGHPRTQSSDRRRASMILTSSLYRGSIWIKTARASVLNKAVHDADLRIGRNPHLIEPR